MINVILIFVPADSDEGLRLATIFHFSANRQNNIRVVPVKRRHLKCNAKWIYRNNDIAIILHCPHWRVGTPTFTFPCK